MSDTLEPDDFDPGYKRLDPELVESLLTAMTGTPEQEDKHFRAGFTSALHRARGFMNYPPDRAARLCTGYDLREVALIASGITAFVNARLAYQGEYPEFVLEPVIDLGPDDTPDTLFAAWQETAAPTEGDPS